MVSGSGFPNDSGRKRETKTPMTDRRPTVNHGRNSWNTAADKTRAHYSDYFSATDFCHH